MLKAGALSCPLDNNCGVELFWVTTKSCTLSVDSRVGRLQLESWVALPFLVLVSARLLLHAGCTITHLCCVCHTHTHTHKPNVAMHASPSYFGVQCSASSNGLFASDVLRWADTSLLLRRNQPPTRQGKTPSSNLDPAKKKLTREQSKQHQQRNTYQLCSSRDQSSQKMIF